MDRPKERTQAESLGEGENALNSANVRKGALEAQNQERTNYQQGGEEVPETVFSQKLPKARRDYKDTLFRMLFHDRESLLTLYNAVNRTDFQDPSRLEIVTLENAIYMNMKNDLACIINLELNIYEHQSTWNPNMPLRALFYAAKEYEKLIAERSLYASSVIMLPTPRFIVFYNGREWGEERKVLRLSDAFQKKEAAPELELCVTVLNINLGFNGELMETCHLLKEYALYVARVRKYAGYMELTEAVNLAVEECIKEGILGNFLRKYRAEAMSVSIFEYNEERERELLKRAEFENGKAAGLKEGLKEGKAEGLTQGIRALIQAYREFGATREASLEKLVKNLSISESQAEEYLNLYW